MKNWIQLQLIAEIIMLFLLVCPAKAAQNYDPNQSVVFSNKKVIEYTPEKKISTKKGTIALWVKPMWDNNDTKSHTYFSMRWDQKKPAYMTLSSGWWEPGDNTKLYFVLNNQDEVVCQKKFKLEKDVWSHIAVTWENGKNGFCKLFVDGEKINQYSKAFFTESSSTGFIYLGSDKGATFRRNRFADSGIEQFNVFQTSMTDNQIYKYYQSIRGNRISADKKHLMWLKSQLVENSKNESLISNEKRVIFHENHTWAVSKFETDRILNRIKKAGFNVYVPCIWHGRGTYYPSKVAHLDERLRKRIQSGEDPLKYLIKKAHSLGIEVHPWFTVVRREDNKLSEYFEEGTPDFAYDVHNIDFRKFIINLMVDVVERYAVDGINLDFIRSMGDCKSKTCFENYKLKYNRDLYSDQLRKIPISNTKIAEWNLNVVSEIVKEVSNRSKKINPELIISVDAHPLSHALLLQGQDSVLWANNDWVDVIYAMDYRKRINIEQLYKGKKALKKPEKIILLMALYDFVDKKPIKRQPEFIANYISLIRQKWPNTGIAFYHFPHMSNELINFLHSTDFYTRKVVK